MRVAKELWEMLGRGPALAIIVKVWFFFLFLPSALLIGLTAWANVIKEFAR